MSRVFVSIDFETTGLNPIRNRIIEFGAVKFYETGEVISEFQAFANAGTFGIPIEATEIHGITNDMVEGEPEPFEVWNNLLEWAGDCNVFIAHHAPFECGFIQNFYPNEAQVPDLFFIDTLKVSRNRLKDRNSYKLTSLVPSLKAANAHRALPDAKACMTLFLELAATYKTGSIPKSQEQALSDFDFIEDNKPSSRQLSYIMSLGGDPDSVSSKNEASRYIDELKNQSIRQVNYGVDKPASFLDRVGRFLLTLLGSLFLLSGVVSVAVDPVFGCINIILGLIVLPQFREKVKSFFKKNKK